MKMEVGDPSGVSDLGGLFLMDNPPPLHNGPLSCQNSFKEGLGIYLVSVAGRLLSWTLLTRILIRAEFGGIILIQYMVGL